MHPLVIRLLTVLADAPPPAQDQGGTARSLIFTWLPIVLMIVLLYWVMIKPQRRREKERQELLGKIKKNDHVVTTGGIHGVVTSVKDNEVTLKVDEANNVRLRFERGAIARIVE